MSLPSTIDLFENATNGQVFDPSRFNIDQKAIQDTVNAIITDLVRHYGVNGDDHDARYYLKSVIDATFATKGEVSGIVLGQIPDGTITDVKLSNLASALKSRVDNLEDTTFERLSKDSNEVYTEIRHKRQDGTLCMKSVLSGGTSPKYTTRTVTYYDYDGTTVLKTKTYTLTYSGDDLTSEVLV